MSREDYRRRSERLAEMSDRERLEHAAGFEWAEDRFGLPHLDPKPLPAGHRPTHTDRRGWTWGL